MNPGELQHRITIQDSIIHEDEIGGQVYDWVDFATVWAKVEALSGREYWAAAQVNAEKTVRVKIRFLPGVATDMRVVFRERTRERTFDIKSVIDPDERQRELILMCTEPDRR